MSVALLALSYYWKPANEHDDPIDKLAQSYYAGRPMISQSDFKIWLSAATRPGTDRGATAVLQVINGTVQVDMSYWISSKDWERQRLQHIVTELKVLLAEHDMPDTEFIFNAADCPPKHLPANTLMFGVTRCSGRSIIPLPQWLVTRDGPFVGWDDRLEEALVAGNVRSWEGREERAVFMGYLRQGFFAWNEVTSEHTWTELSLESCRSSARCKIIELAKQHPDLLDVRIWSQEEPIQRMLGLVKQPFMSMSEQAQLYRYVVYLEGSCGWADRLKYLLPFGFVIFMQKTACQEWFAPLLQPWKHYIPVKGDLSDLVEKIGWARDNKEEARRISDNARGFALTYLDKTAWRWYFHQVIMQYARHANYRIKNRKMQ